MKKILLIVCSLMNILPAFATPSDATLKMLTAAGKEYTDSRNDIIALASGKKTGEEFLAELKSVALDESLPWQISLMANICIERVEKGDEIDELINYKWLKHPEYKREWEHKVTGSKYDLAKLITSELKTKKLWFYYLEILWKDTKEFGLPLNNTTQSYWRHICKVALSNSPVTNYLSHVLNEKSEYPENQNHKNLQYHELSILHSQYSNSLSLLLNTSKEYTDLRNDICILARDKSTGSAFLAELKEIANDEMLPWQTRLMASICIERVEKMPEITASFRTSWVLRKDYDKHYYERTRFLISEALVDILEKRELWFYYLESMWKKNEEYDVITNKYMPDKWRKSCQYALANSSEQYFLTRVVERNLLYLPKNITWEYDPDYNFIRYNIKYSSFQFIFKLWKSRRNYFDKRKSFFKVFLPLAQLEDMDYIREFGKTTKMNGDERAEFNRQFSRLNKKYGLTADDKPIPKSTE